MTQLKSGWRTAWAAFNPAAAAVPLQAVLDDSLTLLDHYGGEQSGTPGFPFTVNLPGGTVRDVSLQMGFVGEQIPCAAFLIEDGLKNHRPARLKKGTAVVDFWAAQTLSPSGVPRVWYDVGKKGHWRDYPTYTRVATDGMRGMLRAWRICRSVKIDKPGWLACCKTYGDWLVDHQAADGSFVRAVDFDGKIVNPSTSATSHPVRFLIDLWRATGDEKFKNAAVRAGDFAIHDIGRECNYYGGTADNDDVTDKEAGWIALDSFLSLYETTGDKKWLDAAARAGDYTETWLYCWDVPIPRDDPLAGLGSIGREVLARARSFGLVPHVWSRSLTQGRAQKLDVGFARSLEDLAKKSDVFTVHLPLNAQTRGVVGRSVLEALPDGAIVVNTARAEVMDYGALEDLIAKKGLRVGLDVFATEPGGASSVFEGKILERGIVYGTPHVGASTEQAQQAVAAETARIVRSFLTEETVPNVVNICATSPARFVIVIRMLDKVGVMANTLSVLKRHGINIEEISNTVFEGATATCSKLRVSGRPSDACVKEIGAFEEVLHVDVVALPNLA